MKETLKFHGKSVQVNKQALIDVIAEDLEWELQQLGEKGHQEILQLDAVTRNENKV